MVRRASAAVLVTALLILAFGRAPQTSAPIEENLHLAAGEAPRRCCNARDLGGCGSRPWNGVGAAGRIADHDASDGADA